MDSDTLRLSRRAILTGALAAVAARAAPSAAGLNVRELGAKGDGTTLDTSAIQKAVDTCADRGGTILFPPGRFLSGTIHLRSRVRLHLEPGAVLLGSSRLDDFPPAIPAFRSYTDNYTERSLIYAERARNISIGGHGEINGQGDRFQRVRHPYKLRPYLMRFVECENVRLRDVTIRDSPMWVQHYLACDDVVIDGVTVRSRYANLNNDGINIDCCENFRVSNCDIDSEDDGIVLKSTSDRVCRNVVITNCIVSSHCNAIKLGTESNGGFQNINVSNCSLYNTRLSGVALELVDGGVFDRVNVSNITMEDVNNVIFVRLGNRARPYREGMAAPGMGSMRNIFISNIQATGVGRWRERKPLEHLRGGPSPLIGCSITGLPGHPVRAVSLSHVRIRFPGGGLMEHALREIPQQADQYPEHSMFGITPAYGFFCRHVEGLHFRDVELSIETPDQRPALFCEDVRGLRIDGLEAESTEGARAALWLKDVREATIRNSRLRGNPAAFAWVEGAASDGIFLADNYTGEAREVVTKAAGVRTGAVAVR